MNDRIKLAEAMNIPVPEEIPMADGWTSIVQFDPFTDANDDYAVLEWMRYNDPNFPTRTLRGSVYMYEIGDYARAALKALDG